MKIIINKYECWIKDDVILPLNFDSMDDDEKWYYIIDNNLLHRENEPAIIYSSGTKEWYLNGLRHRLDGPAYISSKGYQEWYLNGELHGIDGPAFIWYNGSKYWYLNDIRVSGEIYEKIQDSSKEELLMYTVLPKYKDYLSLIEYRLSII